MGRLLLLSPLLSWPLYWLFYAGSTPPRLQLPLAISSLPTERTDIECWTLLLLVCLAFAVTGSNLSRLSKKQLQHLSLGFLIIQPFLLALLRWPQLVETTWATTNMWAPTIVCGTLPSLMGILFLKHHLGFNRLLWIPIAIFGFMVIAIDLLHATGLTDLSIGESQPTSLTTFPWGLLLTIIASAWLSSLLIPYWFLWCSRAERIDDERSQEMESLWKAFRHPSPKVYLWPTACRSSNAVLLGGLTQKKLLLTDKLLLTFDTAEIEWVILHELSHSIRHHALVRMLPTFLAVPSLLYLLSCTQGGYLVLGCLLLGLVFAGLIVATCWWTEWDADKYAIKLGAKHRNLSLLEASTQYGHVLKKLYGSNKPHRTSWTHPSLRQRLSVVEKIT
ncbi:M48 family metalloprotease [Pirellulaceae bacterium SH449]